MQLIMQMGYFTNVIFKHIYDIFMWCLNYRCFFRKKPWRRVAQMIENQEALFHAIIFFQADHQLLLKVPVSTNNYSLFWNPLFFKSTMFKIIFFGSSTIWWQLFLLVRCHMLSVPIYNVLCNYDCNMYLYICSLCLAFTWTLPKPCSQLLPNALLQRIWTYLQINKKFTT